MHKAVNWAALSDRSCRILREIAILTFSSPLPYEEVEDSPWNLSYREAAIYLQTRRETIEDLRPPDPVTAAWVQGRMRELRQEMRRNAET